MVLHLSYSARAVALAVFVAIASLPAAAQVVVLTPDEDGLVERYIVETPLPPPVVIEENLTLRPGTIVPQGVALRPFGGASSLARFSYFVSVDDKVVVVDPATRAVVRILPARR